MKARAVFLGAARRERERVWTPERRARVEALLPVHPGWLEPADLAAAAADGALAEVEHAFSTWGMPALGPEDLDRLPRLRHVFYAAGSVRGFAGPLFARGVRVHSAWAANAVPVAEATLAHVLLALKGTLPRARAARAARSLRVRDEGEYRGAYGAPVGLVALGQIGSRVARLLRGFDVRVLAHDPYATAEQAAGLGVELVGLEELFARCAVTSLHLPWLPATVGLIGGALLRRMPPHATLINTARGAVVREDELWAFLRERPDVTAVLDVTWPEPAAPDSPVWELPNVFYTPHIYGSMGDEVLRMADAMIAEAGRVLAGEPPQHEVTPALLERMA